MRTLSAIVTLGLALSTEGLAAMRPRVIDTVFPTDVVVIASLVVEAPKDGERHALVPQREPRRGSRPPPPGW